MAERAGQILGGLRAQRPVRLALRIPGRHLILNVRGQIEKSFRVDIGQQSIGVGRIVLTGLHPGQKSIPIVRSATALRIIGERSGILPSLAVGINIVGHRRILRASLSAVPNDIGNGSVRAGGG